MMKLQVTIGLFFLLAILSEVVITRQIFRYTRPYKYYHPRPRGHKPRSHPYHGSFHRGISKHPPKRPYYYKPQTSSEVWQDTRYPENHLEPKDPYTIEIELPNRQHETNSRKNDLRSRNRGVRVVEDFDGEEEDYYEDLEDRTMQKVAKGVQIKLIKGPKPKLKIRLSRGDSLEKIDRSSKANAMSTQHPNLSGQIGRKNMFFLYNPSTVEPFRALPL